MPTTPRVSSALANAADPATFLAAWEPQRPLAVLWSGDASPHSRWTILAEPGETVRVSFGSSRGDLMQCLDRVCASTACPSRPASECPFQGGWIGWLAYDAGRVLEPKAAAARLDPDALPLAEFVRVDRALIHDALTGACHTLGDLPLPAGNPERAYRLGALRSRTGRRAYEAAVTRVLDYIRAGDVYQANLAHTLEGSFEGSPRGLFADLLRASRPWFGAYFESPAQGRSILSLSPEQYLRLDPATRRLETRPMKGTRPRSGRNELLASVKEQAELAMIVDLMRNDLGRVCELGSVRVDSARDIEPHAAGELLQATASVSGRLATGVSLAGALAHTFPGGSITGAPKIRAMQIIDELEPAPRGVYCGAIGFVSDCGHAAFNIAIRTATIRGLLHDGHHHDATLTYSIGAGIVADSDPAHEWQETLQKAAFWRAVTSIDEG